MRTLTIESGSAEPIDVVIKATADPTGGDAEFQVTTLDTTTPSGSWSAGTWQTAYDSTTGKVTARTPTVGASGTLAITEGVTYQLWIRWGTVVKRAARIYAT